MINSKLHANILALLHKRITISTVFTLLRIALIPFIVMSMLTHAWAHACLLFTFAALTDAIDGALARFLHEETRLGAYLDPLADKLLLLSCYSTLAFVDSPLFKIPLWFVVIILFKEVLLVLGALYLGLVKQKITIKPTILGKTTTVVQVVFIWWLFVCASLNEIPVITYLLFLFLIVALTIMVFFQYLFIGCRGLYS